MRIFSAVRLLLLGLWLGGAAFVIVAAQNAFAMIPQREIAGSVVGANLTLLNFGGIVIGVLLLLTSTVGSKYVGKVSIWIERFLLLALAGACAVGQFVIGFWMSAIRAQLGKPLDEIAADDPLRQQFNALHEYSVWILFTAIVAALVAFFLISYRKFDTPVKEKSDIYDFSKEFKA